MNENGGKSSTILLTVIGIATLLVVVTGATFAFFAANITGNDNATSVRVQAASTGTTITYTGGEPITLNGIYPRDAAWVTKNIKLTSTAVGDATNTATSKYTFKLVVAENSYDAGDIQYTFTNKTATNVNEGFTQVSAKTNIAATNDLAHGIVPNNKAATVEYVLSIYYVNNTDKNQNNGSERKLKIYVDYEWTANSNG